MTRARREEIFEKRDLSDPLYLKVLKHGTYSTFRRQLRWLAEMCPNEKLVDVAEARG